VFELRKLHLMVTPEQTIEQFAAILGVTDRTVYYHLDMGEAIINGDNSIINADTVASARTILTRRRSREADETLNRVLEIEEAPKEEEPILPAPVAEGSSAPAPIVKPKVALPPPESKFLIRQADAFEFFDAPARAEKFNLLHCDFPYGVVLNGQAHQENFEGGGYESNPEIYWALCEGLARNFDKLIYPSAHVIFWISMEFYTETMEFFAKRVPYLRFNKTPLVWHKTDNRGVLPDPRRGGRNTAEFALFGSVGDRFIVKPVAKSYGAPTGKADAIHTNEKPEPMLTHFLSMVIDHHTRMLDPTAGGGSAIRVAEALGAEAALGLEHNPEFADRANKALKAARGLRVLSAAAKAKEESDV